jgi:hypothetical protein
MSYRVTTDTRRLKRLIQQAPRQAEDVLDAAAFEGERIVKLSFNTSPAGRTYTRGGTTHTASLPGYPPNIDTGKLMNAIAIEKPGRFKRRITTGDTEYAPYLEFGTRKMASRPFMAPMAVALERLMPRLFREFGRRLR